MAISSRFHIVVRSLIKCHSGCTPAFHIWVSVYFILIRAPMKVLMEGVWCYYINYIIMRLPASLAGYWRSRQVCWELYLCVILSVRVCGERFHMWGSRAI